MNYLDGREDLFKLPMSMKKQTLIGKILKKSSLSIRMVFAKVAFCPKFVGAQIYDARI